MKKILVITSSIDGTVDYIINKYSEQVVFFRLNVDQITGYQITVGTDDGWCISSKKGWKIERSDIDSLYYRKPLLPNLSDYEEQYRGMIGRDIISLINGIVDDFSGVTLSKPSILRKTENKTFQLLYAIKNGLSIPKSCIGNSREGIINLKTEETIIKPLTTGKIVYASGCELYQTNYFCNDEEDFSRTPLYIQKYEFKKYEVRLTIVGNEKYTVRIDTSDKLDWRRDYSKHTYSLIECPQSVFNQCRKLLQDFGLRFGAFDFIVNDKDEWIFLEVNPNGQWLWLEEALGIPISNGILNLLIGEP